MKFESALHAGYLALLKSKLASSEVFSKHLNPCYFEIHQMFKDFYLDLFVRIKRDPPVFEYLHNFNNHIKKHFCFPMQRKRKKSAGFESPQVSIKTLNELSIRILRGRLQILPELSPRAVCTDGQLFSGLYQILDPHLSLHLSEVSVRIHSLQFARLSSCQHQQRLTNENIEPHVEQEPLFHEDDLKPSEQGSGATQQSALRIASNVQ